MKDNSRLALAEDAVIKETASEQKLDTVEQEEQHSYMGESPPKEDDIHVADESEATLAELDAPPIETPLSKKQLA